MEERSADQPLAAAAEQPLAAAAHSPASVDCSHDRLLCSSAAVNATDGLLTVDDGRIDQSNFDDNPRTGAGRMDQATFVRCDGRMDQSIGEASVD